MDQFKGRTAFVTGGASGIGLGLCRAFGRRGMNVAIADVEAAACAQAVETLRSDGVPVIAVSCDVSDRDSLGAAAAEAFSAFGNVHILCNNAGVSRAGPIEGIAASDWDWVIGVNLKGLVHGLQIFLPHMKAHGEEGHIINTASMNGVAGAPLAGPYCATKFAVVGISEVLAAELAGIVHQEDSTRPVTAGANNLNAGYNGFQKTVDIFGYNYKPAEYGKFRLANPAEPLFASETASTVSSRGEYFFPVLEDKAEGRADFQVSSYDLYAPRWAFPPDTEFRGLDEFPFTAGEFVWTGFDYLGEPTPYGGDSKTLLNFTDPAEQARRVQELKESGKITVPSRSSYFGIVDLAGFKKDRFYIYQARWRPDFPMAHILPHWNWPERAGQVTPVHVYTSGDEAELFLNGRSLGRKKKGQYEYRLRWNDVKYEPGELKVLAYKNGKRWAEDSMKTTGPANRLLAKADRGTIKADGQDLSFVTITVADRNGLMVPRAKNRLRFSIAGPGEIVAVDNGDATNLETFQSPERNAYNGLCLVIVRAKAGQGGQVKLKAQADGLAAGEILISSRAVR